MDQVTRVAALGRNVLAAHKDSNAASKLPQEFLEFGVHTLANVGLTAAGPIAGKLLSKPVHGIIGRKMVKHYARVDLQENKVNVKNSRAVRRAKVTKEKAKRK